MPSARHQASDSISRTTFGSLGIISDTVVLLIEAMLGPDGLASSRSQSSGLPCVEAPSSRTGLADRSVEKPSSYV